MKYDVEKLLSKNKFPQSLKSTRKYSSKFNGYRSVINIPQSFEHVQNKNLIYTLDICNLQTKIKSHPDQEKLLKR